MDVLSPLRRAAIVLRRRLRRSRVAQAGLIFGMWLLAEVGVRWLHLPIPSSIIGMAVLLCLLARHWIAPQAVARGAEWLLAEMLLFFVPAAMIVLDHPQILGWIGVKLLLVVIGGTLLVMLSTALSIDLCYRWSRRHGA